MGNCPRKLMKLGVPTRGTVPIESRFARIEIGHLIIGYTDVTGLSVKPATLANKGRQTL